MRLRLFALATTALALRGHNAHVSNPTRRTILTSAPAAAAAIASVALAATPHVARAAAAAVDPASAISPSRLLTVRQYLGDVKEARRGLDKLAPLIQDPLTSDNKLQARGVLRKPPTNGVRKACTKILDALEPGTPLIVKKTQQYDAIKQSLGALDDGLRETSSLSSVELLAQLDSLESAFDAFSDGFPAPAQTISQSD